MTRGHQPSVAMRYEPVEDGWWGIPSHQQDRIAQESQGPIADRTREFLGTSDQGIVMLRKIIRDSIKAVEKGRDPFGVLRDPAQNMLLRFDAGKNFSDGVNRAPAIIGA
jgi:5,5'-dehydrodivanillate O-demethylase